METKLKTDFLRIREDNEEEEFVAECNTTQQVKDLVHRYNCHPQLLEALKNLERRATFGTVTPDYLSEARKAIALATGKEVVE